VTKERKAQALTVLLLAGALAFAAYRSGSFSSFDVSRLTAGMQPKGDPTPQDAIYAMLDAGRAGNVRDYLAAHTGQMATSLEKAVAEASESGFAAFLKQTNEPVKGVALQEPRVLTDREVKVRVEYVFGDRNEVQWMYLEKTAGGEWKIARVDTAEQIKTLVPYGTPVQ